MGQDEGGGTQPSSNSQIATSGVAQDGDNPHLNTKQEGQSSGHSLGKSNASSEDVGGPHLNSDVSRTPLPVLPQAPTNCFSREEIIDEVLDLMDQVASVALFGSIGIGKSFIALSLLHHNRTQAKFGRNRHFMRCDNLTNSLESFLEHLSDAIHTNRSTNVAQLRSQLESSPPFILLLDGVDFILDPLAPEAEDISATIEEFSCYNHVCLVTTSRMHPDIHGFHRIEVPTLSQDGARDAFYSRCSLNKSPVVDDLIASLDFHPLSMTLLANSVHENGWNESMLLKVWDDGKASGVGKNYYQSLKDAVEPALRSPTIQSLGATAQNTLVAIAAFPNGVEKCRLEEIFPGIAGIGKAVDVLCKFSLIYCQDGFVKMLSPFQFYFLMSILGSAECAEVICWDGDCHPAKACMPLSFHPFDGHRVMLLGGLPIYTSGKPACPPPRKSLRLGVLSREKWAKGFQSVRRSERNNSGSL